MLCRSPLFLVFVVAIVGGCASVPPPGTAEEGLITVGCYRPGESPQVKQSPAYGTYGLYRSLTPAKDPSVLDDAGKPQGTEGAVLVGLCRIPLREAVGFKRDADGQLYAVAGQDKFPLRDDAFYFWQGKPEPNSIGPEDLPKPPRPLVERLVVGVANEVAIAATVALVVGVLAAYFLAAGHTM
jgi:hypothetical protein